RRWVRRWRAETGERVDYAPSQEIGERFPEIPRDVFQRSVVLVTPGGDVFTGAEAALQSLSQAPGPHWVFAAYRHVPGFAATAEAVCRFIARQRTAGFHVTNVLWGKTVERPTFRIANAIFLRAVGICFFAAFVSLWVQVDGLIGSHGILPIGNLLDAARS